MTTAGDPTAAPFTLGQLEFANRIVGTPHGTGMSRDASARDEDRASRWGASGASALPHPSQGSSGAPSAAFHGGCCVKARRMGGRARCSKCELPPREGSGTGSPCVCGASLGGREPQVLLVELEEIVCRRDEAPF
jgi:hypothetical protein